MSILIDFGLQTLTRSVTSQGGSRRCTNGYEEVGVLSFVLTLYRRIESLSAVQQWGLWGRATCRTKVTTKRSWLEVNQLGERIGITWADGMVY
jgi:hypothetical protein